MSPDAFNVTLALCQSLPGPNVVNISVVVGARSAGAGGAVVALLGLIATQVGIVLVLATLYERFGEAGGARRNAGAWGRGGRTFLGHGRPDGSAPRQETADFRFGDDHARLHGDRLAEVVLGRGSAGADADRHGGGLAKR